MGTDEQSLSESIRELAETTDDEKVVGPLHEVADQVERMDTLLQVMHEFIESEYRPDFEDTLDYETQEIYRERFGLSHNSLFDSPDDEIDDDEDPLILS